ncbi:MAG: AMP-binding protein [Nitrospira sp.]|nr:AMP-binding protein [Nitrospira sp.]
MNLDTLKERIRDAALTWKGYRLSRGLMAATPFFSQDQLEAYQLERLRTVLDACYRYVPYYQKLFWEHDFDPHHIQATADLKRLPILTKDTVRTKLADFCSMKELRTAIRLRTSGTTGTPLSVYTSAGQWVVEQGAIWRHWGWAGYRFRDRMAIIRSYSPKAGEPLWKLDRLRNWLYCSPYHLSEEQCRAYLDVLAQWKPRYLRGYPSSLYVLARVAKSEKRRLPGLRAAFTASETLLPQYRTEIEEAFGVKVFDHYGQAEITAMLHECEAHEGLHVLSDYGYVEFLPSDQTGLYRMIATNLQNTAMPLLRYDTGDLVELADKPCSCGRTFPLVKRVVGRSDQLLLHRDGYPIPSINLYTYFAKQDDVVRFQIIQWSQEEVEVRIAPRAGVDPDKVARGVRHEMQLRFGGDVNVVLTQEFEQSGEGKCLPILQKARMDTWRSSTATPARHTTG